MIAPAALARQPEPPVRVINVRGDFTAAVLSRAGHFGLDEDRFGTHMLVGHLTDAGRLIRPVRIPFDDRPISDSAVLVSTAVDVNRYGDRFAAWVYAPDGDEENGPFRLVMALLRHGHRRAVMWSERVESQNLDVSINAHGVGVAMLDGAQAVSISPHGRIRRQAPDRVGREDYGLDDTVGILHVDSHDGFSITSFRDDGNGARVTTSHADPRGRFSPAHVDLRIPHEVALDTGAVARNDRGDEVVAWQDTRGPLLVRWRRHGHWERPRQLANQAPIQPAVALNDEGAGLLAYGLSTDGTADRVRVLVSTAAPGRDFGHPSRLPYTSSLDTPGLALDPYGRGLVVWAQSERDVPVAFVTPGRRPRIAVRRITGCTSGEPDRDRRGGFVLWCYF